MAGYGSVLLAGIGALITIVIFSVLAPLFNEGVTLVLANSNSNIAQLLIQLAFPILILVLIYSVVDHKRSGESLL